jgi:hypothetical protein
VTTHQNPLTCAFGSPWPCAPCLACALYAARLEQAFHAKVRSGELDRRGYRKTKASTRKAAA